MLPKRNTDLKLPFTYLLFSDEREDYLLALARDNTQILVNAIWNLPTERVEEVVVAKFPAPAFKLPREKPLPAPKQLTKWEKYAKEKGKYFSLFWSSTYFSCLWY